MFPSSRNIAQVASISAAVVVGLSGPALATSVTDPYSGATTEVRGASRTAPVLDRQVRVSPATLPFSGGEAAAIGALGLGALVGGTALVVAGRRRSISA